MPQYSKSIITHHSTQSISNIVLDIDQYCKFLPWCTGSKIIEYTAQEIIAELSLKFATVKKSYISKITVTESQNLYQININSLSNTFLDLHSYWQIEDNSSYRKVCYYIDYNFNDTIAGKIFASVFNLAQKKILDSFMLRIEEITK